MTNFTGKLLSILFSHSLYVYFGAGVVAGYTFAAYVSSGRMPRELDRNKTRDADGWDEVREGGGGWLAP